MDYGKPDQRLDQVVSYAGSLATSGAHHWAGDKGGCAAVPTVCTLPRHICSSQGCPKAGDSAAAVIFENLNLCWNLVHLS